MADLTEYTGLITSEHNDKPKFMALVSALSQPAVDIRNGYATFSDAFDLDDAVGVQLDAVGLWAGIGRSVPTPLAGVYFSFDVDGLGFDQGVWQGPFDPDTGVTNLDDDTYRLLIKTKIGANHWDGTLASAVAILSIVFNNDVAIASTQIVTSSGESVLATDPATAQLVTLGSSTESAATYVFIDDHGDMSISIAIAGNIPPIVFLALLKNGYIPLKPSTIHVDDYSVTSVDGSAIFGFDAENDYISGFDTGAWAVSL